MKKHDCGSNPKAFFLFIIPEHINGCFRSVFVANFLCVSSKKKAILHIIIGRGKRKSFRPSDHEGCCSGASVGYTLKLMVIRETDCFKINFIEAVN